MILDYLAFCQQQVVKRMPLLDLEALTGHGGKPFTTLELQIYSIRDLI